MSGYAAEMAEEQSGYVERIAAALCEIEDTAQHDVACADPSTLFHCDLEWAARRAEILEACVAALRKQVEDAKFRRAA